MSNSPFSTPQQPLIQKEEGALSQRQENTLKQRSNAQNNMNNHTKENSSNQSKQIKNISNAQNQTRQLDSESKNDEGNCLSAREKKGINFTSSYVSPKYSSVNQKSACSSPLGNQNKKIVMVNSSTNNGKHLAVNAQRQKIINEYPIENNSSNSGQYITVKNLLQQQSNYDQSQHFINSIAATNNLQSSTVFQQLISARQQNLSPRNNFSNNNKIFQEQRHNQQVLHSPLNMNVYTQQHNQKKNQTQNTQAVNVPERQREEQRKLLKDKSRPSSQQSKDRQNITKDELQQKRSRVGTPTLSGSNSCLSLQSKQSQSSPHNRSTNSKIAQKFNQKTINFQPNRNQQKQPFGAKPPQLPQEFQLYEELNSTPSSVMLSCFKKENISPPSQLFKSKINNSQNCPSNQVQQSLYNKSIPSQNQLSTEQQLQLHQQISQRKSTPSSSPPHHTLKVLSFEEQYKLPESTKSLVSQHRNSAANLQSSRESSLSQTPSNNKFNVNQLPPPNLFQQHSMFSQLQLPKRTSPTESIKQNNFTLLSEKERMTQTDLLLSNKLSSSQIKQEVKSPQLVDNILGQNELSIQFSNVNSISLSGLNSFAAIGSSLNTPKAQEEALSSLVFVQKEFKGGCRVPGSPKKNNNNKNEKKNCTATTSTIGRSPKSSNSNSIGNSSQIVSFSCDTNYNVNSLLQHSTTNKLDDPLRQQSVQKTKQLNEGIKNILDINTSEIKEQLPKLQQHVKKILEKYLIKENNLKQENNQLRSQVSLLNSTILAQQAEIDHLKTQHCNFQKNEGNIHSQHNLQFEDRIQQQEFNSISQNPFELKSSNPQQQICLQQQELPLFNHGQNQSSFFGSPFEISFQQIQ